MNQIMQQSKALSDELPEERQLTPKEQIQSWYELAATSDGNDSVASMLKLYNPNGEPEWYISAANRGDKYACYVLGKMYYWGVLVQQNYTKAAMWYAKASSADISFADYELAKMCAAGQGLDKDQDAADQLYIKAYREFVKQEKRCPNSNIEYKLAIIYENGLAGETDLSMAQYWRNLASGSNKELVEETPVPAEHQEEKQESEPDLQPVSAAPDERQNAPEPKPKPVRQKKRKEKTPLKVTKTPADSQVSDSLKSFMDMVSPSAADFGHPDYYVIGNTFRCVWAIREYPAKTDQCAILKELGEMDGVTLKIFISPLSPAEENKIIDNSNKRNNNRKNTTTKANEKIEAEEDLNDIDKMLRQRHNTKEKLLHCSVFIEMVAVSLQKLKDLQQKVMIFCSEQKIVYDSLWLLQKEGFLSVMLTGQDQFKSQFQRAIPAGSVANLYPFSYSGKTDPNGMYIGQNVRGSNIIVNFDRRTQDKTNGHIVILGNSGQGKSHLIKLLATNFRQAHKRIFILDPEDEYRELTINLGACYLNMMAGKYFINVLEPHRLTDNPITDEQDEDYNEDYIPVAFKKGTILSQHIAYLRDWFRCYKEFSMEQLDTLEILLEKLYQQFDISDDSDFDKFQPNDYPILSDLFELCKKELEEYDEAGGQLYTKNVLRSLTLGLRSICVGSESTFFNGYTNITNADFIDFSVKGMLETNENLKNAMFMNIFSYMSHKYLTEGDAVLAVDELYLFVSNPIAVNYLRSFVKRGRKKNSDVILASQNVEDLMLPGIKEYTKPLLSIPTHSFLFNPGDNCDEKEFQRFLSLPECEYDLIREPNQGFCLFKCGNERYHLHVIAPPYKSALFGNAGGQ